MHASRPWARSLEGAGLHGGRLMDVCGTSLDAPRPLYDSHSGLLYQHLCVSGLPPISSPHPLLEQGVVVI